MTRNQPHEPGHHEVDEQTGAHRIGYTSETCGQQEGDATSRMKTMLQYTLEHYPPHYQAALRTIMDLPEGGSDFVCVGAMETGLSEEGMTVAFDFRRERNDWRRIIAWVTMSFGEVVGVRVRQLLPGEHSGIPVFEQAW